MRPRILVLFLCAGSAAFCQPAVPAAMSPDELGRLQAAFIEPAREINKLAQGWHMTNTVPPRVLIRTDAGAARTWNDARIDPRMIVHPPPSSVGVQLPGTLVAKNQYPKLRFRPVEWPCLKLQKIPTQWPRFEIVPVGSGTLAVSRAPVK